jgi:hypothetical protein
MLFWHLWASQDPKVLIVSFPDLNRYAPLHIVGKAHHPDGSPKKQTSGILPVYQSNVFHLPARMWSCSNKPITSSHKNQMSSHTPAYSL